MKQRFTMMTSSLLMMGFALASALIADSSRAAAQSSRTAFARSSDGTRIAYDVTGTGPVLMLLHGGRLSRRVWHDLQYVDRLRGQLTVVTIDLRGHGESERPTTTAAYAVDQVGDDLLAVADAVSALRFTIWGFSYGANVGRYLAARSDRVEAMGIVGIPFGAAASGSFRQSILDFRTKWSPLLDDRRAVDLDQPTLSAADRATWERASLASDLAWTSAMLDWPDLEPEDMRCRTLWLVGSANEAAMDSVHGYRKRLAGTRVIVEIIDGWTHQDELVKTDDVLPRLLRFARARRP